MTGSRTKSRVAIYRPACWNEVVELGRHFSDWIFRGIGDASFRFQTTFERTAARYGAHSQDFPRLERALIERFQRAAHLHFPVEILPEAQDWLGWMSLIQHYGGPTRLLDFTESFYCAAFFAVESTNCRAAIWAVDRRSLESKIPELECDTLEMTALEIRREERFRFNASVGLRNAMRYVMPFFPERLHERLAQQQGLFLAGGRVDVPFEVQLFEALEVEEQELSASSALRSKVPERVDLNARRELRLVKIEIEPHLHRKARAELKRMNLTSQSIYPGPDGYAKALHWEMGLRQPGEPDFVPENLGNPKSLSRMRPAKARA